MFYADVSADVRFERLATHWQTTPDIARRQTYIAQELAFILASIDAEFQAEASKNTSNTTNTVDRNKSELARLQAVSGIDLAQLDGIIVRPAADA